jgi:hypothetical protein
MLNNKTRRKLIDGLEIFHECLCSDLAESGRDDDAMAVYEEIVVKGKDPKEYVFITVNKIS